MPDNLIPAYQVYRLSIREPLLLMVVLLSFTFAALKLPPPAPAEKSIGPVRSLGHLQ
jgi:hypothetical protein